MAINWNVLCNNTTDIIWVTLCTKRDNTHCHVLGIYKIEVFYWHKLDDSKHHVILSFPKMAKIVSKKNPYQGLEYFASSWQNITVENKWQLWYWNKKIVSI